MVRILYIHCQGLGLIPGQGVKIPQAMHHGQKIKNNFFYNVYSPGTSEFSNDTLGVSCSRGFCKLTGSRKGTEM